VAFTDRLRTNSHSTTILTTNVPASGLFIGTDDFSDVGGLPLTLFTA
jgi:hypothetical protein